MGSKYADPVILDLRAMWEESDPRTPMICLLSMGSDPTAMIEDLAKKNGIGMCFCIMQQKNAKSFPSHTTHRAALISVSLALSHTPVYTARP